MKFLKLIIAFAALVAVFGRRHRRHRRSHGTPEEDFDGRFNALFATPDTVTWDSLQKFLNSAENKAGAAGAPDCAHPNESLLGYLKTTAVAPKTFAQAFRELTTGAADKKNQNCADNSAKSGTKPARRRRKYFY